MGQKFANNAIALLSSSITAVATSMTVEAAKADRFPVANTPGWGAVVDWYKASIFDSAGNREIVKVGVRGAGSNVMSNLLRAQDGTVALPFAAGSVVMLAITAADIENVLAGIFPSLNISGGLDIGQYFHCQGRAYTDVETPGAHAADLVIDATNGNVWELPELTSNINTMTINNAQGGQTIEISVKQAGAGTYTVAVPAGAKVVGTPATGVGRVSKLYLRYSPRDLVWQGLWVPVPA